MYYTGVNSKGTGDRSPHHYSTAVTLINSGMANQLDGIREIDLRLENQDDAVMLMDFAAQMNCHNRVA